MSSNGLSLKSRLLSSVYSFISGFAYHPNGTVNRRLLNLLDIKSPPSITPINGVKSSDHTVDPTRNLWFRLFVPEPITADDQSTLSPPMIIFFHGGGFVGFSASTFPFDDLCRRLAGEVSAVVISVNYRLSPEHKFPAPYDDGFDVVKFLDSERDTVEGFPASVDLGRCFLAGDSAGGNIAHHVAVRIAECDSEFKTVRIRGLVAIQPFFGGEERMDSEIGLVKVDNSLTLERTDFFWKAFLPNGSDRDHPACNVFGPNSKDISGLEFPPTLLVIGGLDLLQDWQRRYCDGLKRFGYEVELVEYPNMFHGFYCATELNECSMLVARIKEFLYKKL